MQYHRTKPGTAQKMYHAALIKLKISTMNKTLNSSNQNQRQICRHTRGIHFKQRRQSYNLENVITLTLLMAKGA
jgi:hypothetical protein